MSIFTTLFGYGQEKRGSLKKITEIKNQDPNFADLSLNIISKKREGNYTSFIGKGLYKNKIVGIEVLLINDIEPGIVNDQISQNGFNKLGVIIPSNMKICGLNRFATEHVEEIEEFKNNEEKLLKL